MSSTILRLFNCCRPTTAVRRYASSAYAQPGRTGSRSLAWSSVLLISAGLAFGTPYKIYLDSQPNVVEDTIVDPATSISFPKSIKMPENVKLSSPLTLVGVGVRTVSFLGIRVYSVGFYADLNNSNLKIPADMPPEDKIKYIIRNSSCLIRIVPTRSTSYTHLRDAFMRALQTRLASGTRDGTLTEEVAQEAASPLRKLKSIFPNAPLAKHTPLDIFLSAPISSRPRALVFQDLGSIEHDWVATEFVLHYFEGDGPSPPLKKAVLERVKDIVK